MVTYRKNLPIAIYTRQGQNGNFNQPATAHKGSPMPGSQASRQALGPNFSSQASALRCVVWPLYLSTALCAPKPSHQSSAPPKVLPAVATKIAGQNKVGLSLTRPKTTGSEPRGNRVADMKDTTNTVLSPSWGRASICSN